MREAAYRAYYYQTEQQQALLDQLLFHRAQLANLVGFPTYAHRYELDAYY